ncbi:hypothetical protein IFT95_24525, partial [Pantoea agglomerans]|nr:hypothetical protein [Pantoea agglomerans]
ADFTYVSTWQGFAYVAFIIDVFAGRIVGWKVGSVALTVAGCRKIGLIVSYATSR